MDASDRITHLKAMFTLHNHLQMFCLGLLWHISIIAQYPHINYFSLDVKYSHEHGMHPPTCAVRAKHAIYK